MPGFEPCSKCGAITDNHELRATEEHPHTYYCNDCIDRMKALHIL